MSINNEWFMSGGFLAKSIDSSKFESYICKLTEEDGEIIYPTVGRKTYTAGQHYLVKSLTSSATPIGIIQVDMFDKNLVRV